MNLYTFKVADRHLIIHLSSDSGTSCHVLNSIEPFPRKHKVFGEKIQILHHLHCKGTEILRKPCNSVVKSQKHIG